MTQQVRDTTRLFKVAKRFLGREDWLAMKETLANIEYVDEKPNYDIIGMKISEALVKHFAIASLTSGT